mmetsp:Transcript_34664/g.89554  ORF Transcript_34664/g.89554 Transcript_34664/m.89554 type:complete len:211 (+) Transcript_34664:202-834(+)
MTSMGPMRDVEFSATGTASLFVAANFSSWSSQPMSTKSTHVPSLRATKESWIKGSASPAGFFDFFAFLGSMFSSTGLLRTSVRSMKTFVEYLYSPFSSDCGTSNTTVSPTLTIMGLGGNWNPSPTSWVSQSKPQHWPVFLASKASRSSKKARCWRVSFEGLFRTFLTKSLVSAFGLPRYCKNASVLPSPARSPLSKVIARGPPSGRGGPQ